VKLAARGARNMDTGAESVRDEAEVAQLRQQARRVHVRAIVAALALTTFSLFAPE
jgi:hypothetical protein